MDGVVVNYLDVFILFLMGIMALKGVLYGFINEISGLVGIVGGFFLAGNFYNDLASVLQKSFGDKIWLGILAYAIIFITFIFLVKILAAILNKIASFNVANSVNRILGCGIGLVKGFIGVAFVCMFLTLLLPKSDLVKESKLLPYIKSTMDFIKSQMPTINSKIGNVLSKKL